MAPNKMLMELLSSVYYNDEHDKSIATNPSAIRIMEILPRSLASIFMPVRRAKEFFAFPIERYDVEINSMKRFQNTGFQVSNPPPLNRNYSG